MAIHPHSSSAIGLIRDEQKIVGVFVAKIETRLGSEFFQHDALGNMRNSRTINTIGEEEPMGHQFSNRGGYCHKRLLTNEDTETTWMM
eukprot:COSAG02_NODE_36985_length_448_cov_0.644699_2_plen_87_part_01